MAHLRIHGKGGKLRYIPLHPGTADQAWEAGPQVINHPLPLFPGVGRIWLNKHSSYGPRFYRGGRRCLGHQRPSVADEVNPAPQHLIYS